MRRKKKTIIIVMCIAILLMGTGYAILSTQLNINGSTAVTSTWKVEFSAIRTTKQRGGATNKVNPTYTATTASFQVDLVQPGDEITYEIDITNYGDIKSEIKGASYDITGSEAIYVEIEGIRKGTVIDSCEGLSTCPTVTATIRVGYDESVTKDPSSKTKNIKITLNIGQYVDDNPTPDGELIPELKTTLVRKILNDNTAQSDASIDFSQKSSDTNGKGLYYTSTNTENGQTTYYFRGAVTNNYVSFADQVWRIVRINEDGSVRLITDNRAISSGSFNGDSSTYSKDNAYAGYMHGGVQSSITYGDVNADGSVNGTDVLLLKRMVSKTTTPTKEQMVAGDVDMDGLLSDNDVELIEKYTAELTTLPIALEDLRYEATHRNIFDSVIKTKLDEWYQANLASYSGYLADAGFCNDRSLTSGLGYSTNSTTYAGYTRLATNKTPQFSCPNAKRDLFTTSASNKGNKALDYPIGLITADEIAYSGVVVGSYSGGYLTNYTWTMTPVRKISSESNINVYITTNGGLEAEVPAYATAFGAAPVINVRGNVEVSSGDGTSSTPYVIKTS